MARWRCLRGIRNIGRLTERRINGNDPATYAYDKANRIKTITYRGKTVAYTYDGAGRLVSRTLPNGLIQTYTWNEVNEVTGISYKKPDGTVIESLTYAYDALGNPIRRSRSGAASKQETGFSATYDAANRMLTYNGLPLTYDANGNLIARQTPSGTVTYAWNARNQLTQITGPNGTASFKYDHAGRRIEKTINGVTTTYLYDGNQAIAELQGSSVGTTYLTGLQIDEVLAIYSNKGNRTALTDALGSILALTDDTQATKTSYSYSPYGETQATGEASDNPYQYTGRENDNTGLYYYRARYYMPDLKRFLTSDPIGLEGGINEYTYVENNPLTYIDPDGLRAYQPPVPPRSISRPSSFRDPLRDIRQLGERTKSLLEKISDTLQHKEDEPKRDCELWCKVPPSQPSQCPTDFNKPLWEKVQGPVLTAPGSDICRLICK